MEGGWTGKGELYSVLRIRICTVQSTYVEIGVNEVPVNQVSPLDEEFEMQS